jgi:hypothetical protein
VSCPSLLTPGRIARSLSVPLYRVNYILATRRDIQPSARAGNVRLFSVRAMARIRHEISAIDAKRTTRREPKTK